MSVFTVEDANAIVKWTGKILQWNDDAHASIKRSFRDNERLLFFNRTEWLFSQPDCGKSERGSDYFVVSEYDYAEWLDQLWTFVKPLSGELHVTTYVSFFSDDNKSWPTGFPVTSICVHFELTNAVASSKHAVRTVK